MLASTYQVEALLAEGGMGAVYRVRHLRTGGAMAVKLLSQASQAHPDVLRRFQEEARITSGLRHPNIVQVTDFDEDDDGTPFLVMELLEGEDLMRRLKRAGRMPLGDVLDLARQVGGGLQAAHERGVVHRDVKPQNIFFARHSVAGETFEEVKIVDFGLSKVQRPPSQQTLDDMAPGTPVYMAPETIRGGEVVDGRADQFSLAVVLFRCLSGVLPFDSESGLRDLVDQMLHAEPTPLGSLVPGLPAGAIAAIERALSKRPADRFPSVAEFVRVLTGQPQLTGRRVAYPPPSGPTASRRSPIASLGSLLGTTLTGAAGQFAPEERPRRRGRRAAVAVGGLVGLACAALLWNARPQGGPRASEPAAAAAPLVAAAAPVAVPLAAAPSLQAASTPEPAPAPLRLVAEEADEPAAPPRRKKGRPGGKRRGVAKGPRGKDRASQRPRAG